MALRPFYAYVLSKAVLLVKQTTEPLTKRIDLLNMFEKEAVLLEINRSNRNMFSTLRKKAVLYAVGRERSVGDEHPFSCTQVAYN